MTKTRSVLIALLSVSLTLPFFSLARAELIPVKITGDYVPNQIIVGYRNQGTSNDMAAIREQVRREVAAKSFSQISPISHDTELIELGQGFSVGQAMARLQGKAGVRFVEPNFIYTKMATSNDPIFTNGSLWGMYGPTTSPNNEFGSNAAAAWNRDFIGSKSVVIGVIDEGIQITHPDLRDNIWTNPGETPGNGKDDDGNGYVDDINGWDFVSNNDSVYDGTGDDHGTHVAGTIGARGGNGVGVAGVNWNVTLISAKFLGARGGSTANAIKAVDYLTDLKSKFGVNIIATSNSWGGGGFSQGLLDAINRGGNAGILFVAAAGNDTRDLEMITSYPAGYKCDNDGTRGWDCVVSVASITSSGALSSFSNFGAVSVDLGAPGSAVTSTVPTGTYASYSGTSMATPHVSGAVALCNSMGPNLTASQIRAAIMKSVVPTASLEGRTVTGGRLNIGAMTDTCASQGTTGYFVSSASASPNSASVSEGYSDSSAQSSIVLNRSGSAGSAPSVDVSVNSGTWSINTLSNVTATRLTSITSASGSTITLNNSSGSFVLSLNAGQSAGIYSATIRSGTNSLLTYTVTVGSSAVIAPTAVQDLSCSKGKNRGTATCKWSAPSSPGSSSLLRYEYRFKLTSTPSWPLLFTSNNLNLSVNLRGLTVGSSYNFEVRAVNTSNATGVSSTTSFTP